MRIILFLAVFISSLLSKELYTKIVDEVYLSENLKGYELVDYRNYKRKDLKEFSIKIVLKKEQLKNKTYYLTVVSDINSLTHTNVPYVRQNHLIIVKLDKNTPKNIYFNYKYENEKWGEFRTNIISEFEHDYILHFEGILYGVAYGIILCAFIYYIVIYFSTRLKCFLYYSLMQLFVLFSLIWFTYFSFRPYIFRFEQASVDICETLAFLFMFLFVKEILFTKKSMPKINKLLDFIVVLNIIDIFLISIFKFSILYEYIPFYIAFLIPTIAGVIGIYKRVKYSIVYTFGWFMMFCFIFITNMHMFPLSGIYAIHIAAPLESLIFSFALGLMLRDLVNEQNEKEKLLIHKSKLASMGEMINNIAHQWRQPLTHLSFINMNLQLTCEEKHINRKFLAAKIEESNQQIDFMSNTIDSFRDFYKPVKDKEWFFISNAVQKSVNIMKPLLDIYSIELEIKVLNDKKIKSYENEFCQVIVNLITNAKDELVSRAISSPKIVITVDKEQRKQITTICDNAGGIKLKNLNKIFEPYFSTKESGSGIGLYMSKTIIESHFKGELKVRNNKYGACFSIEL